ncbi:MAG: hypothetical protein AABY83_12150 [Pseudomonadota bacterium]
MSLILICRTAYPVELSAAPAVSVGYLYIDDINPATRSSSNEAAQGATISPQLAARLTGAHIAGDFDGILQYFRYNQGEHQNVYQARGMTRLQALPNTAFMDIRGSLAQRSINYDPLIEQNRFQFSDQRRDVWNFSLAPAVVLNGARSRTEFQYTREIARVRGADRGDFDSNRYLAAMTSKNAEPGQATWEGHVHWRDTGFRDRGDSQYRDLGINYRFSLSRLVEADLTGGLEYNRIPNLSIGRGVPQAYWLAGTRIKPTLLLDMQFAAGQRNFGATYRGAISYRMHGLAMSGEYAERVVDTAPVSTVIVTQEDIALILRGPHISRRLNLRTVYDTTRTRAQLTATQDKRGYALGLDQDVLRYMQAEISYRMSARFVADSTVRIDYNISNLELIAGTYTSATLGLGYLAAKSVTLKVKANFYNRDYAQLRDIYNAIYMLEMTVTGG